MAKNWATKEKPLTLEEVLELAKNEYAPYWKGSPPLMIGVEAGARCSAHPIDPEIASKKWLGFFLDPTFYSGESALQYALQLNHRYSGLELTTVVFLNFKYSSLQKIESLEYYYGKTQTTSRFVLDIKGILCRAFKMEPHPGIVLMSEGKQRLIRNQANWYKNTDHEIQSFLRSKDLGLALLPVINTPKDLIEDIGSIEFGKNSADSASFVIKGLWKQEPEKAVSCDNKASCQFETIGTHLAVTAEVATHAQSQFKAHELIARGGHMVVELDGRPVHDAVMGGDLIRNHEGRTVVNIHQTRVYQILNKINKTKKYRVTLLFPDAGLAPIGLYGIRFGNLA